MKVFYPLLVTAVLSSSLNPEKGKLIFEPVMAGNYPHNLSQFH